MTNYQKALALADDLETRSLGMPDAPAHLAAEMIKAQAEKIFRLMIILERVDHGNRCDGANNIGPCDCWLSEPLPGASESWSARWWLISDDESRFVELGPYQIRWEVEEARRILLIHSPELTDSLRIVIRENEGGGL